LLLSEYATLCDAREALLQRWSQLTPPRQTTALQQLKAQFTALWRRTLDFNLQAPPGLQIAGIRVDFELRAFENQI